MSKEKKKILKKSLIAMLFSLFCATSFCACGGLPGGFSSSEDSSSISVEDSSSSRDEDVSSEESEEESLEESSEEESSSIEESSSEEESSSIEESSSVEESSSIKESSSEEESSSIEESSSVEESSSIEESSSEEESSSIEESSSVEESSSIKESSSEEESSSIEESSSVEDSSSIEESSSVEESSSIEESSSVEESSSIEESSSSEDSSSKEDSSSEEDSSEDSSSEEVVEVTGTHYNVVAVSTHWGASNNTQITFKFSDVTNPLQSTVDLGYLGWTPPDEDTEAFKQYIKINGNALPAGVILQGLDKKDGLCLAGIGPLSTGTVISIEQGATFTHGEVSMTMTQTFTFTWNGTTYTEGKAFGNGIAFMASQYDTGVNYTVPVTVEKKNVTNLTYTSSNPSVATIDANGNVTGKKLGTVRITATATISGTNKTVESTCIVKVQPPAYETLNGTEECVRFVGRTFVNERGVNCYTTASGIEVNFYGTELKATITSTGISIPRLCVLVDGETDCTARMVDLSKATTTAEYTLVSGLAKGNHTVKIYKVTEAYMTAIAFSSLKTDGYLMKKPIPKAYQFEVYGDSITAGLHSMKQSGTSDPALLETDYMQNGCITYAFKTAQAFDADLHVMARSGIGAYSAWDTPNPLNPSEEMSMLNMWDRSYISDVDRFGTYTNPTWDFSKYTPDLVIINIGTNDTWHRWEENTYKTALTTLCNNIFTKYGNEVKIVLVSGMMVTTNTSAMQQVQQTLANQGKKITHVQLNTSPNGHPGQQDHQTASELLINHIRTVL